MLASEAEIKRQRTTLQAWHALTRSPNSQYWLILIVGYFVFRKLRVFRETGRSIETKGMASARMRKNLYAQRLAFV